MPWHSMKMEVKSTKMRRLSRSVSPRLYVNGQAAFEKAVKEKKTELGESSESVLPFSPLETYS